MSLPNRKIKTAKTFKLPSADDCKYEHVPKEHQSRSLSTCSPESTNKKPPSSDFDNIRLDNIPLSLTLLCVTDSSTTTHPIVYKNCFMEYKYLKRKSYLLFH